MMHRRRALVAAALLLTVGAVSIGCGPKAPPPPGGAFTDLSRPAARAHPSGSQAGEVPSTGGAVVLPPGVGPAAPPDATAVKTDVGDYLQRAREYEQEQEDLREQELESAPPSDMWVPVPEAPEAEETQPLEDETGAYPSG